MGEAKRRGDYEKRKAEAIAAGRVKGSNERPVPIMRGPAFLAALLSLSGFDVPWKYKPRTVTPRRRVA